MSEPDRMEELDNEDSELTRREQDTAGQLRLLDPELAGLYARGILLARQIERPGTAYLVAHVGRELSRGVLEILLRDEGLEVSPRDLEEAPLDEKNRPRIASALRLEGDDPRVDEWFRLLGQFSRYVHWRHGGPRSAAVRDAFERFSSLLYGRVAPYYETEAELDALLEVETPTAEHARRLRDLQLRLGQRHYFFTHLKRPTWLEYLAQDGFFRSPPGRQVNPDQSWSARPWPEGHYLVEVAGQTPAVVTEVLCSIPMTNDNPVVWDLVAKAACHLPPEMAVRLIPGLSNALVTAQGRMFSQSVVDFTVALARGGRVEAFKLADFLLRVVDRSDVEELEGLRYGMRTEWVFPRFGWHDHQVLLDRLVAALEALDADRTLRFLLSKLQRVQRLAKELDLGPLWRLHWADKRERADHDDLVTMLIGSAVGVAHRLAESGPDEAAHVMRLIDGHEGDFFTRIGYIVLSKVGQHLQERVDWVLSSEEAQDPGFPATEIAALLRAQFRNASPGARKRYAAALETGPNCEIVRAALQTWHGRDPTEIEIEDHVRHFQRRIITFFRGDIPEELGGLAEEVGAKGVTPSHRDQQLAEVGSYTEGGAWGGDDPPVAAGDLSRWTPEEVLAFLVDWRPVEGIGASFGMQGSLATYARENAGRAVCVLARAVEAGVDPRAVEGIIDGLSEAARADRDLDWAETLGAVRGVIDRVLSVELGESEGVMHWRRAAGRAARLIEEGCDRNSLPIDLAPHVWTILRAAAAAPAIWQLPHHAERSLDTVIMAELNDASGNVTTAVVSAALWNYRSLLREDGQASEATKAVARAAVDEHLMPVLDRWLQDEGPNAAIPRAVMGDYLPHLHLIAPEWIETHAADLLEGGLEDPSARPTWTTYISRAQLYDTVFTASRIWYAKAAEGAADWRRVAGDAGGARDITQKFAVHLVIAVLRELVSVGDEDRLLETAYANLSPSDWDHAYWAIFRGWSDADDPIPADVVQRLVGLWEWRIAELEKRDGTGRAVEEAKALGWLFHTPYIPDADVVRLGQATARLARGEINMYSRWERMIELAQTDVDGAFAIAEMVLLAELRAAFVHVSVDDIRPFLAHVLAAGGLETQQRARSVINRLGERGFRQFKDLLEGSRGAAGGAS